jgi:glycosyltransferase involved in cell wall biosynthesis
MAAAERYDVHVLALHGSEVVAPGEVTVHRLEPEHPSLRRSLPAFWRRGGALAKALNADLYFASDLYSLPVAARAARARTVPLLFDSRELYTDIAALHGRTLTQRFWRTVLRMYARRAAMLFTVNESIADILRKDGYDVRVLRNLPERIVREKTDRIRQVLNISATQHIVLSQGGIQRGRGALLAVRAVAAVPDCALVFLGDGAMSGEVVEEARRQGCALRVHILPAVPSAELLEWTASADVGLCLIEDVGLSYRLSLPNKLFEYIAAGVPVLGSDLPEIARVVRALDVGSIVPADDAHAVSLALAELLHSPERLKQYREHCLAHALALQWQQERGILLDALGTVLPH